MESKRRSLAKAFSWRFIASTVTGLIVWFLTGELEFAFMAGIADTIIKIVLYFAHERIWLKIPFGKPEEPEYEI